jgi:hypothetical protein
VHDGWAVQQNIVGDNGRSGVLEGPAKFLFTPLGLAVVFAMLASYTFFAKVDAGHHRPAAQKASSTVNTLTPSRKNTLWPCHWSPRINVEVVRNLYHGISQPIRAFRRAMSA